MNIARREVLGLLLGVLAAAPAAAAAKPRIGIIGAGRIGGALAQLFAQAGYPVMVSARDVDEMETLAKKIGHGATAGSPREAAAFGDIVMVSTPWGAMPQIGADYAAELKGKIVIDTCNPNEQRDGPVWSAASRAAANDSYAYGSGVADQKLLPGTRLVKAFNVISELEGALHLVANASHPGTVGIPIASDDTQALRIVAQLVADAGYVPVTVGGLSTVKIWDNCHPDAKQVGNPDHPHAAIACSGAKYHTVGQPAEQMRALFRADGVKDVR